MRKPVTVAAEYEVNKIERWRRDCQNREAVPQQDFYDERVLHVAAVFEGPLNAVIVNGVTYHPAEVY